MTPFVRLAAAALSLALIAGCSPREAPAKTEAGTAEIAPSPDVHPFRVGALQAWSLKDGDIVLPAGSDEVPWKNAAAVTAVLAAAGRPTDEIRLSIQPLLVRDGDRLVLIDTGAGGAMGTENRLMASLRAAGIDPDAITDVLISHAHGDHVGGLATAAGVLNFPNAVIRMSAPEWRFAQAGAEAAGAGPLLAAIKPKVQTFAPGARITPSITAVPLVGHTPGHSGYEIASDGQKLLYIGAALHSSVVSVARPDLVNAWDTDAAAASATRRTLLETGAAGHQRIYAGHFPWPGVGRFQARGEGFVWAPES